MKKLRRPDPDAPKTGDETYRNFWFLMMGISAAGILFMTRKKEQE
ncbi:MAG: LPXTG cell wall anchor domain-containing protein [Clostridiales bacterium]|nr:LPXTG cell wall anchor domain-containing protein [Clostridiales bacterium]